MNSKRITSPKGIIKPCVLMVSVAMLTACQTHSQSTTAPQALVHHPQDALAYANQSGVQQLLGENSPSAQAKRTYIQALIKHLQSERYAVTVQKWQLQPLVAKDSIDANADPLLVSVLKTINYMNAGKANATENTDSPVYRQTDSYFNDDNAHLPYLRYDDEQSGTMTSGMSIGQIDDTYHAVNYRLNEAANDYFSCSVGVSVGIDDVIKNNPTATVETLEVQKQLETASRCGHEFDARIGALYPLAKGYQKNQVDLANQCKAIFEAGLEQVLSKSRKISSYAGENRQYYDASWSNYWQCHQAYTSASLLEPVNYLNVNSEKQLQIHALKHACYTQSVRQVNELFNKNKSYRQHPELFSTMEQDNATCQLKGVYQLAGIGTDADLESVKNQEQIDHLLMTYAYGGDVAQAIANQASTSNAYDVSDGSAQSIEELYGDWQTGDSQADTPSVNPMWGAFGMLSNGLDSYLQMKQEQSKQQALDDQQVIDGSWLVSMFGLDGVRMTAEQIAATNLYSLDNAVYTSLTHHVPAKRQIDTLLSFDFSSPVSEQSLQLPMSLDFNRSVVAADASAILPILAVSTPHFVPSQPDFDGKIRIDLQKQLSYVPADVLYDAVFRAVIQSIKEMDSEKYTFVDISNDDFAKQVGAVSAIKVDYDIKDWGQLLGVVAKTLTKDIQAHLQANPDKYGDEQREALEQVLHKLELIHQGYHTRDVGGLWQLVSALTAVDFSTSAYVYLDTKGEVVASQYAGSTTAGLQNRTTKYATQIRYSKQAFDKHPLAAQFAEGIKPSTSSVDWFEHIKQAKQLQQQAARLRDDITERHAHIHDASAQTQVADGEQQGQ